MFDLQDVGDVEGPVPGFAGFLHGLRVQVTGRGHEYQRAAALLREDEAGVANLTAGNQEVEAGTQGIAG